MFEGGEDLHLALPHRLGTLDQDDLDGDTFFKIAVGALTAVDDAHAAAADFLGGAVGAEGLALEVEHGALQEAAHVLLGAKEFEDLLARGRISAAEFAHEGSALLRRLRQGFGEDLFDSVPGAFRLHGSCGCPASLAHAGS